MKINIERHAYFPDRTMGILYIGEHEFRTLERPWIPTPHHLGGTNFDSCVPDGSYLLQPFDSEDHPNCFILSNEKLDVFTEMPKGILPTGRWGILIHSGNYLKDIVGCIAPGMTGDEHNVWNSVSAMDKIRDLLGKENHTIVISPKGAKN